MIHGTSVFSMADLNGSNGHLYAQYKKGKYIFDIECLEENTNEGTTHVRNKQTQQEEFIKTSRIINPFHSNELIW